MRDPVVEGRVIKIGKLEIVRNANAVGFINAETQRCSQNYMEERCIWGAWPSRRERRQPEIRSGKACSFMATHFNSDPEDVMALLH